MPASPGTSPATTAASGAASSPGFPTAGRPPPAARRRSAPARSPPRTTAPPGNGGRRSAPKAASPGGGNGCSTSCTAAHRLSARAPGRAAYAGRTHCAAHRRNEGIPAERQRSASAASIVFRKAQTRALEKLESPKSLCDIDFTVTETSPLANFLPDGWAAPTPAHQINRTVSTGIPSVILRTLTQAGRSHGRSRARRPGLHDLPRSSPACAGRRLGSAARVAPCPPGKGCSQRRKSGIRIGSTARRRRFGRPSHTHD